VDGGELSVLAAAADPAVAARPALITAEGETMSFGALAGRTRALLADPPPAALVAESRLPTLLAVLAHLHARTPMVLLHARLTEPERAELGTLVDRHRPLPAGILAVMFTSGTTGRPKAALLGRAAFLASARASAANLGWRDDDRWLLCLPLAHVGGLSVVVRCLAARRTVVVAAPAAQSMAAAIARHRVTLCSLVPTQAQRLLEAGWRPPPHLRAILLGGAGASPALLAALDDAGWPVLTTYGLTEACSQVTTQTLGTRNRGELGSGPPLPGARVRIAADGAIEVAGPTLFAGYLGAPAPFTADGFLRTGDLGTIDAAGNLHVRGRLDDAIVTGGEKVHPAEVEACLETAPGVAAACVFAAPDEVWGQVVCAALVPRAERVDEQAVTAHLETRLAAFKRPRRVFQLPALALTPAGKLDRPGTAVACLRSMPRKDANEGEGSQTAAREHDEEG
jgi:o-succinylbenzoate---CoA ligase